MSHSERLPPQKEPLRKSKLTGEGGEEGFARRRVTERALVTNNNNNKMKLASNNVESLQAVRFFVLKGANWKGRARGEEEQDEGEEEFAPPPATSAVQCEYLLDLLDSSLRGPAY